MSASLLPGLTVVALGGFVPAFAAALSRARGRHASCSSARDRWGRVAVAATVVAVAGGAAGVVLGAGPASVATAAALLAAPVLVWAALAPWWPVRAVVAWALLVAGSVGMVATAAGRALESSLPWSALPVAGVGSAVVVLALGRVNGAFRSALGIRDGVHRAVRGPVLLRPALLRPALTLAVFLAAMGVGGLTGVGPGPGEEDRPEASPPGTGPGTRDAADGSVVHGSQVRTVSADTAPGSGSAGGDGAALPGEARRAGSGGTGTTATGSTDGPGPTSGSDEGPGAATPGSGTSRGGGPTGTADGSSDPTSSGSTEPGGDPDPVVVPPDEPVTETVEQVTEPVMTVVEETLEQVTEPIGSVLP